MARGAEVTVPNAEGALVACVRCARAPTFTPEAVCTACRRKAEKERPRGVERVAEEVKR